MKTLTLIFMTLFLAKSCDAQMNEEMENTTVEYQSMARNSYLNINIHSDKISITKDRKGDAKTSQLTKADFTEIATLLRAVKAEELPNLKAPTDRRMYDGAAHATLKIIHDGTAYETSSFDHGDPPAEIKKLVDKMVSFINE